VKTPSYKSSSKDEFNKLLGDYATLLSGNRNDTPILKQGKLSAPADN